MIDLKINNTNVLTSTLRSILYYTSFCKTRKYILFLCFNENYLIRGECLSTGKSGVFPGNHLEKWSGSSQEVGLQHFEVCM